MQAALALDAYDLSDEEVRGRFDWAVRQGCPIWLWPDTTVQDWQAALAQIEMVVRQVLTAGHATTRLAGRPEDISVAGYTSGLGPLLAAWLGEGLIDAPASVAADLDLHLRHNALRMAHLARHATAVVDQLARSGVGVVVLKGMDTAWSIFPDPATRPLSDIDLLIDPADESAANAILRDMGYVPGETGRCPPSRNWRLPEAPTQPRTLAFVHRDDPWAVDLQASLNRRYSRGVPVIELDRIKSPAMLEPWTLSPDAWVLAAEARLIHLACHASCGLESLSLLRLVEIVMTVRAQPGGRPIDWDRFIALAEHAGALAMTYPALRLAEQLAPGTFPQKVLAMGERAAPARVRRVLDQLAPHNAQRIVRCSVEERFMWSPSPLRRLLQLWHELYLPGVSALQLPAVYRARAWRVLHGRVTR